MPFLTTKEYIERASKVYGSLYDYSKIDYKSTNTKIEIICPVHGMFLQTPKRFLMGYDCQKCSIEKRAEKRKMPLEEFLSRSKEIHNNKYDYSKTESFKNALTYVTIICPIHGEFQQRVTNHLQGYGCRKCATEGKISCQKRDLQWFKDKANLVHENKYNYSDYNGSHEYVEVECPEHGKWKTLAYVHLQGNGCPRCRDSQAQGNISNFIKNLGFEIKINDRTLIYPQEIDIFIPEKNIAIEYDSLFWHSEQQRLEYGPKTYHLNKTIKCNESGIRLIHIFEDEWINKEQIVKNRLKAILGIYDKRISGRETEVREINTTEKNNFLNKYHIQGEDKSSIRLGAFLENEMTSVMTFSKPRIALGSKNSAGSYELTRFVSISNTSTPGIASKLFSHFIKNYNPDIVYSYSDKRWNTGNLYLKLGFAFDYSTVPNYWYIDGYTRIHRFNFRKQRLPKLLENFNPEMTEYQNMLNNGYDRIWDCGNDKFIWKKSPNCPCVCV